ncbi:hypothetical protein B0T21DRAFT_369058 [Apiosordaria backusii]|uniref:Uncharacterized protein n=1 Tax=Apiosordaria backusii TaxID=314023 RepID=A0AA40EEL7_9PEZI|nr:hypothetical protein B0T21DRAFT_369058 [Apiosordaria backusii]
MLTVLGWVSLIPVVCEILRPLCLSLVFVVGSCLLTPTWNRNSDSNKRWAIPLSWHIMEKLRAVIVRPPDTLTSDDLNGRGRSTTMAQSSGPRGFVIGLDGGGPQDAGPTWVATV